MTMWDLQAAYEEIRDEFLRRDKKYCGIDLSITNGEIFMIDGITLRNGMHWCGDVIWGELEECGIPFDEELFKSVVFPGEAVRVIHQGNGNVCIYRDPQVVAMMGCS